MLVTTPNRKKKTKPNVRRKSGGKENGAEDTKGRSERTARGRRNGSGPSHGTRKSNGSGSQGWLSRLGLRSGGSGSSNGRGGGAVGPDYGRRVKKKGGEGFYLPRVKPWKLILGALAIGGLGVLYLSHVFATQELLREVQNLEREYNQVRRANEDLRLTYDRMIGPAAIYENAKELGFINGGPAEKVIEVERDE
ncbi:MAG: hypothetical protein U5K31_10280 [Balneolaceae bacterium]|nr:hypothetical protein [Balneolaceae bacterium]